MNSAFLYVLGGLLILLVGIVSVFTHKEHIEKEDKTRIPRVGEKLHFFDDGKSGDSRHYLAIVTHVLTPEQMKRVHWIANEHTELYGGENNVPCDFLGVWRYNKKQYHWIFADDTDYFIGCAIPEYDDHIIWFAREKNGSWFSMDAQSCWQGGFLDVTGEKYDNMIKEGYEYSERI